MRIRLWRVSTTLARILNLKCKVSEAKSINVQLTWSSRPSYPQTTDSGANNEPSEISPPNTDSRHQQEPSTSSNSNTSGRYEPPYWTCTEPRCPSYGKKYNRLDNYNRHKRKIHSRIVENLFRFHPYVPNPDNNN